MGQRLQHSDTNGGLYSGNTLRTCVQGFFGNFGGSPWAGVQTQYCRYAPPGTTSCSGISGGT